MKLKYEAADGKLFGVPEDCREYERTIPEFVAANRSPDELKAALAREDLDLADALETLGTAIRNARLAARDLKRRPSQPEAATLAIAAPRPDPHAEPAAESADEERAVA